MSLEAFVWEERFATGIPLVDAQHKRLLELVNRLGHRGMDSAADGLPEMIAEVRAYADYHFRSEEAVWKRGGVAAKVQASHRRLHLDFSHRIAALEQDFAEQPQELARLLHEFLCSWLVMHILGEDQELARQIQHAAAVRGEGPEEATVSSRLPAALTPADAVLLQAVQRLYAALSTMNTQLRDANRLLDARVAERTRELSANNEALARERDRLVETNRQLVAARSRLLERERLASIGQLAAGVAHEINNPIGFVGSNLNTLAEYLDGFLAVVDAYTTTEALIARDPEAIAAVHAAKKANDLDFVRQDAAALIMESSDGILRVKRIVQDLKDFARVDNIGWQPSDLLQGLESTLNLVAPELRQKAELRRELAVLPEIHCHPGQLNRVFMSLLMNAAQAIEERGTITVRSGADSEVVWIEIEDDGCGIAPEDQPRVFDPFFTSKPVGQGTGLGLFLAWNIVHEHHGQIEINSRPGAGSRFRVVLPRVGPTSEAPGRLS